MRSGTWALPNCCIVAGRGYLLFGYISFAYSAFAISFFINLNQRVSARKMESNGIKFGHDIVLFPWLDVNLSSQMYRLLFIHGTFELEPSQKNPSNKRALISRAGISSIFPEDACFI